MNKKEDSGNSKRKLTNVPKDVINKYKIQNILSLKNVQMSSSGDNLIEST